MGCSSDATQIPYYNTPDFTPIFLSENQELKNTITHQISDFSFELSR